MPSPRHKETPLDHERGNWKLLMVAALSATEKALDGLPIPAAKICISLILKFIEAGDVAADNEKKLQQLRTRYQELKVFLSSETSEIPKTVQEVMDNLDLKLKKLAERWEPRLTKKPRRRDVVLKLITASDDRDALLAFVTEIDQAIHDFLMHFQVKGWIETYRLIVEARQVAALASMHRAQYASYKSPRSGGARTCLEGTRMHVLTVIKTWALHPDCDHPPVFWLNGVAGIGKSTIAHTVATWLDTIDQLGGSFVFLKTDDQLSNGNLLFPTLAFQLSSVDSLFKSRLAKTLEDDPGCVASSPKIQFEKLIRRPLSTISISKPLIVVLDALDECHSDSLEEILWVIINAVKEIPFLRVFITSRPEGQIRERLAVKSSDPTRQKLVLHEDMHVQKEVERDIRLYLKASLQEIWAKDHQGEWPRKTDLETLVEHSGKLFIYAATMVRFIGGNRALDLDRQLGVLLNVKVGDIPVSDSYRRLDQLYLNILDAALPAELLDDPYYIERFQKVVGSIVLMQRPLPLEALAHFLTDYEVSKIRQTLYYFHSIIVVPDDPSETIRTYHLSFPNFITNPDRCTNRYARVNPQKQQLYLFLQCLDIIKKFYTPATYLEPCRILRLDTVDPLHNQIGTADDNRRSNIQRNGREKVVIDDFYSVNIRLWPDLATKTPGENLDLLPAEASDQLIDALEQFLDKNLLQWLNWRIAGILVTTGATNIALAQDTFNILHSALRWVVDNIHSQKGQKMEQMIVTEAQKGFDRLYPGAWGHYTLGDPLHPYQAYAPGGHLSVNPPPAPIEAPSAKRKKN